MARVRKTGEVPQRPTSGSMSTFLPAAISKAYIFLSAVTAYAFKEAKKSVKVQTLKEMSRRQ